MIWKGFYLAFFLGGLALAVHVMLHGMTRWRRKRSARPSALFNPPTVAALGVGFGAAGYLLFTRADLGAVVVLLIALSAGIAAFIGMTVLMAKWAFRDDAVATHEEYDLSGQVATVTRAITQHEPGQIAWFAWDERHVMTARSIDGSEVPEGTEVVIDVVEDGAARVELWSVVERRL